MQLHAYVKVDANSPSGLTWCTTRRRIKAGTPAFSSMTNTGYYEGRLMGKHYRAHRVVFFLVHGWWPEVVDHIDGNTHNNVPCNLRASTAVENQHNRVVRGCSYHKSKGKWVAKIEVNKRRVHLGYFDTEDAAHAAYLTAKATLHPTAPKRCFL